jgi:NTP pyrophosphatase (non-canonical NTP hydrolase)
MKTFTQIQSELKVWEAEHFPNNQSYHPLLGALEELGELAHAHLKADQGIRGTPEDHALAARDAVADVVIYLMNYCNHRGWDLSEIVETTWEKVSLRNWNANKLDGS